MNALLIYPECPETFWSFKHALRFVSKKAANPPLGLLTVAALLPKEWNKKVVDMNVSGLLVDDILKADWVFISACDIQRKSTEEVILLCKKYHKKIAGGGPLFTASPEDFPSVDTLILNEGEITIPLFLKDLKKGYVHRIYKTGEYADLTLSPIPDYSLLDIKKYVTLGIQFTRGCPFNCEFCNVTAMFGHKVRMKQPEQIIAELENLFALGWQGNVFFVDDNFIGNKSFLKRELLPALIQWMTEHNYPFVFNTEATINLADDEELIELMANAGFDSVFIGIESPSVYSLVECNKVQNLNRDLVEDIHKIHRHGLLVTAGFIVGFDSDHTSIFQQQIDFIKKSGIISAMVGLLNAPKNTKLYERLKSENRLKPDFTGNNTDLRMNFIPKMDYSVLIDGYRKVVKEIYAAGPYYRRVKSFLKEYKISQKMDNHFSLQTLKTIFRSMYIVGFLSRGRRYYWGLLIWSLIRRPSSLRQAITFTIYGYHFRKIYNLSFH
ncbi:MAG: B12-binding domain-containing radical SAM protein [Bacteroidota bacterium]|nr:B12-binding domain-containing radical SAM protein [Bacteroidota bacterium]